MRKWVVRVRAAVGMGLSWAVAWAPVGLLVGWALGGNSMTPDQFPLDDWVMPFAAFGFLGGTTFSVVLRIADGRRRFDELSLPRFGAWGALGGLVVGVLAVAWWQLDAGFGPILLQRAAVLVGSSTLLSAASSSGSLLLARRAEVRGLLGTGKELGHVELPKDGEPELIGSD